MVFYGIVAAAAAGGTVWLVRWLFRWKDPSWDSRSSQSKAFMWSKRGGSGGFGS